MPLPTSGPLSLNDIHIEAGGTSATLATINDVDIRGLISKASGTQMRFNEWYGADGSTSYTINWGGALASINYSGNPSLNFESNGETTVQAGATVNGDSTGMSNWLSPFPAGTSVTGLYQVRATVTSGTMLVGSTGTWLTLSSDRFFVMASNSVVTFQVRLTSAGGTGSSKVVRTS